MKVSTVLSTNIVERLSVDLMKTDVQNLFSKGSSLNFRGLTKSAGRAPFPVSYFSAAVCIHVWSALSMNEL